MGKYRDLKAEFNRLHKQATDLAIVAREATQQQVAIVSELNSIAINLINASEEFWKETLNEIEDEGHKTTVHEIKMDFPEPATPMDKYTQVTRAAKAGAIATSFIPGKRACSACRQPGHRAKNCPNAHIVQQQKKEIALQPKKKRTRKPMTQEQRAAAVQRLVKARAMKGKRK